MLGGAQVLEVVLAGIDVVVVTHYRLDIAATAVALQDLVHRQPGLDVLGRLVLENVAATLRAEVITLAFVFGAAMAEGGLVVRLAERQRDLADLAEHRQGRVVETLALLLQRTPVLEARAVDLVEGVGIFGRQPVQLFVGRHPGMEVGRLAVLVEDRPGLVADVVLGDVRLFDVLGRTDAVALQVLEQRPARLFEIHAPGFGPGHDFVRQHVVHHHSHQRQQAVAAPEPLVDPALDDRHVVFVLLQQKLDHFQAQGHVSRFVGLCREAKGDRGHVAVERRSGHERHEQQVGQHVLERERDCREELERSRRARVFEERLGHREEPHAVVHMREIMQAVEVLVVVTHRVNLSLHVA
ncbi:hypothetical protein D3C87_1342060 [compost metagenome]